MHIYVSNYGVHGTTHYYCNSDETYEGQMSEEDKLETFFVFCFEVYSFIRKRHHHALLWI